MDQDAITLMTLHGAKGLEWPIVLMHGLDRKLEPDVFGAHLMNDEDVLRSVPGADLWPRSSLDQ